MPLSPRTLTWLTRCGLLLLVALPVLALLQQGLVIHPDTGRDLMLAAQCLEPEGCLLRGPPASLAPLYQGGLWIAHLAGLLRLGLDEHAAQVAAALLYVTAVLCVGVAGERLAGRLTGLLAAALLVLWPTVLTTEIATQWNPTLFALPAAVLAIAAMSAAVTGQLTPWLLVALATATLVQLHLAAGVLVPCLAALFVFFPPHRPLRTALLSVAVLLACVLALSRDALEPAWLALTQGTSPAGLEAPTGLPPLPFLLGAPALAAAWWLSPWTRRNAAQPQVWALLATSVVPVTLLAGLALLQGQDVKFYYFAPFRMGLALLLAWWLVAALHALTDAFANEKRQTTLGLALLACTVPLLWPHALPPGTTTFADTRRLAHHLASVGVCSPQDWWRLQGPIPYPVFIGLQAQLPQQRPCRPATQSWLLWRDAAGPAEPLPPDALAIPTDIGDRFVLLPRKTALDWQKATLEAELPDDPTPQQQLLLQDGGLARDPGYPHLRASRFDRPWRKLTLRWPLHLPAGRALTLLACSAQPETQFAATDLRVIGWPAQRDADGTLHIAADALPRSGWLQAEWRALRPGLVPWLPNLIELQGEEAGLAATARRQHWPRRCATGS